MITPFSRSRGLAKSPWAYSIKKMTIIGLILAFALVVVAVRLKINLGHGLLAGCLLLGLAGRMGFLGLGSAMLKVTAEPRGLVLILVVGLLMVLVQIMEQTGQWQVILAKVETVVSSPRLSLAIFPALIGLLPMPGGTLFSAPMVQQLSQDINLSRVDKSLINYWFRHVWEYSWPLYPAIILASSLGHIPLPELLKATSPVSLAAIVVGFFLILKKVPRQIQHREQAKAASGSAFRGLLPILIILAGALGGPGLLSGLGRIWPVMNTVPEQSSMALALVAAVLIAASASPEKGLIRKIAFSKHTLGMVYLVAAILVFKNVAVGSGAIDDLGRIISSLGLPLSLVVSVISFLIGLITGFSPAYVATGFPVFIGLVPDGQMAAYLMLGHATGFAGVLLSPAHACLVLSNKYFQAPFGPFYRRLIPVVGLSLIFAGGWAWFLITYLD